jgi:hypothetical protein
MLTLLDLHHYVLDLRCLAYQLDDAISFYIVYKPMTAVRGGFLQ